MNVPLGTPSTYRPVSLRQPSRQPRPLAPVPSTSSSSLSSAPSPAESVEADIAKKKRCRVTKEQLHQLEILFAANMSPTIDRRKEIAIALGMTERQTQIWFQNRYVLNSSFMFIWDSDLLSSVPHVAVPSNELQKGGSQERDANHGAQRRMR